MQLDLYLQRSGCSNDNWYHRCIWCVRDFYKLVQWSSQHMWNWLKISAHNSRQNIAYSSILRVHRITIIVFISFIWHCCSSPVDRRRYTAVATRWSLALCFTGSLCLISWQQSTHQYSCLSCTCQVGLKKPFCFLWNSEICNKSREWEQRCFKTSKSISTFKLTCTTSR